MICIHMHISIVTEQLKTSQLGKGNVIMWRIYGQKRRATVKILSKGFNIFDDLVQNH